MKKLLSLLSVVTISGTAVPTTIAASPYQKEETIKNSNFILQKNNLINLNRKKRANEQECPADGRIAPTLHIEWDDSQPYIGWIQRMTTYLNSTGIIENINNQVEIPFTINNPTSTYGLNSNPNINYFFVPVQLNNDNSLYLVFNSSNLYLEGFINNSNIDPSYHVLADNNETNIIDNVNFRGRVLTGRRLGVSGNYTKLWPISNSLEFSQNSLTQSFINLINYRSGTGNEINRGSLARIIFITAEALRFNKVWQLVGNSLLFHNIYPNENGELIPRDEYSVAFDRADDNGETFGFLNEWRNNSRDYLNLPDNQLGRDRRRNLRILHSIFLSNIRENNNRNCGSNNRRNERSIQNNQCYGKMFYFNEDKSNKKFSFSYGTGKDGTQNHQITINLGEINPINFERISFIGDTSTHSSWGNDGYHGTKISDFFKNENIKEIIKNKKVSNTYSENEDNAIYELQRTQARSGFAGVDSYQNIGLTFYWENGQYYLQILVHQRANSWATSIHGAIWLNIGKGIILYND